MTGDSNTGPVVADLRDRTRGDVLLPGDDGYDAARTVWNATVDRRPAVVVRPTGAADVLACVDTAREHDVRLSVKGGGHHVSGSAVPDGGVLVDLCRMDAVRVDPDERTARVQAGATWGDVDHETQAFGLAVPGGQDPNIGVAGLTLGGGVGWLSRQYGLTCDNLLSADVVTADGRLVRASDDEHPDLFWALRGGGGAFGAVTSFEYRLHEVGPEIVAGSLLYPLADVPAVARRYRSFLAEAPREVRPLFGVMELPAASYYPPSVRETRVAMLLVFSAGPPEAAMEALAPLREAGDPVFDSVRRRSYRSWQRAGTSEGAMRTDVRSQYLPELSEPVIDTIDEHANAAPSSGATVFVSPRDGAVSDPPSDATAYPHRDGAHHLLIEARWTDPARDDEHRSWVRRFHDALAPYTTGDVALNFATSDETAERRRATRGDNDARLVEVKTEWDPENRFRTNAGIEPRGPTT